MGMARQMGSMMFGAQLGQGLGTLAGEVLGAADVGIPLTEDGRAALLPRNVAAFGEGLGVDLEQVRLYLALRENAAQRLFAHVPVAALAAHRRGRGLRRRHPRRPRPDRGGRPRHRPEQPRGDAGGARLRRVRARGHPRAGRRARPARGAARPRRGLGRRRRDGGERGTAALGRSRCARRCAAAAPPAARPSAPSPPSWGSSCGRAGCARRHSCGQTVRGERGLEAPRRPLGAPRPAARVPTTSTATRRSPTSSGGRRRSTSPRSRASARRPRAGRRAATRASADPSAPDGVSLHDDATALLGAWTARPVSPASRRTLREDYLAFLDAHDDAMWRSCVDGHLTASALVLSRRPAVGAAHAAPEVRPVAADGRALRARRRHAARARRRARRGRRAASRGSCSRRDAGAARPAPGRLPRRLVAPRRAVRRRTRPADAVARDQRRVARPALVAGRRAARRRRRLGAPPRRDRAREP